MDTTGDRAMARSARQLRPRGARFVAIQDGTGDRMNRQEFARWWAQAWSNRDIDVVAACFADSVRFVDGRRKRACEFMQFDDEGKIVAGEAMHGCGLP